MQESFENAVDELKRVDHLIYVSLKYTRTCDIFKNIFGRMISAIDFSFEAALRKLLEDGKIDDIPEQAGPRCNVLREHYQDPSFQDIIDFYLKLRQINRADFSRDREYRRHVTMTVQVNDETLEVNIDNITEYYRKVKEAVDYIKSSVGQAGVQP